MSSSTSAPVPKPFGSLLRRWRARRALSQLDLALQASVSGRHISFLETGRASPSRDMVLRLSDALDVPLRERNALLGAAGFAPLYRETDLDAPEMGPIKRAISFLLEQHEPFPAVLLDHRWNLLRSNRPAARVFGAFSTRQGPWLHEPLNLMRISLEPEGLRPFLANWEETAGALLATVLRAAAARPSDLELQRLFADLQALPEMPAAEGSEPVAPCPFLVLPLHLRRGDLEVRMFSVMTTLGTSQDITLQDVRIESFMPADEASERTLRELAEADGEARPERNRSRLPPG